MTTQPKTTKYCPFIRIAGTMLNIATMQVCHQAATSESSGSVASQLAQAKAIEAMTQQAELSIKSSECLPSCAIYDHRRDCCGFIQRSIVKTC